MSTKNPAPAKNVPGKPAQYTLCVIEFKDGLKTTHCKSIMSPEQFAALMKRGRALRDLNCEAILQSGIKAMTMPVDYCELENAVAANNALVQLLAEHVQLGQMDSGVSSFMGMGDSATLCAGLFSLMNMVKERLKAAAEVAA